MPRSKPYLTRTQHLLPFNSLGPEQFERLCLWLIRREGFTSAEHLGVAGCEQGRDLIGWRDGKLWAFQCKRIQSFTATTAIREVNKLLELPADQIPRNYCLHDLLSNFG